MKHPMSRDVRGTKNPRWRPATERFWEKVRKTEGCWEWVAATNKRGYGIFKSEGRVLLAHRWVMRAKPGECALHHCDNPACVRPSHMYIGSYKDNARDRNVRRRSNRAKLTREEARWIYQLGAPVTVIAKCFGVSHPVVSRIKSGEAYAWATREA